MLTIQIFKKWQPLVSQGNFYRQLGGNHLQCMLRDHFGITWVVFQTMSEARFKPPANATAKRILTSHDCFPATNVTQELSTTQLLRIIRCEFVTSKIVSHSQEVWTRFYEPQENYVNIQLDFLHVCIKIASYDAGLRITFLWKKKSTPSKLRLLISLIKTTEVELLQFLKSDGTHLDYKCAGMECNTTVPCFWQ